MKNIVFAVLCLILLAACTKKSTSGHGYVAVHYALTQCADPWGNDTTSNSTIIANAKHYLDSLGVAPYNLYITNNSNAQFCLACTCTTGKNLRVSAPQSLMSSYKSIGFLE